MNKLLGLGIILLILFGCQQESKTGVIGQQFVLKTDIPDEVGTFDYIWKITDLPESSELMLSDIQFSEDESQAIFVPDVAGHFTVQVTVWKYNDKLGAFVYNYDITDTPLEVTAQQQSRDDWLNETVDVAPTTEDTASTMEENVTEVVDEVAVIETSSEPAVTKVQPTAIVEANYTIQVAAESKAETAAQHVNRLINAGYDAYSLEHITEDNKTLYRIRIGKYMTREDALQAADKIANDQGLPTWVTQYQK
jgi:cell division septation protein DedD